jgi:hypothetical protein
VLGTVIAEQQRPGVRAWRDLSKWRLLFGLALAPVPPIAVGVLILLMIEDGLIFTSFGVILATAETWSLPIGTLFLVLSRWRGIVRRAHCLLLGAFLAFSLPAAATLTSATIDRISNTTPAPEPDEDFDFDEGFHGPSDAGLVVLLGLFLIPFGTLGGWVFWRVGVYPARPKLAPIATVFD